MNAVIGRYAIPLYRPEVKLTATSAEDVRLVAALSETGGTLRCSKQSVIHLTIG